MSDEGNAASAQAGDNSISIGGISVGGNTGDIRIGHTIGYSAEQVSALITQISTTFQAKAFDGTCPYKGLDYFEEEDADLFFGREKLVDELVGRVKESRTVFITGPSGSGKSSLVRAGLIHALKQGVIKGSEKWVYAAIKPGRDPMEAAALAFSRLKSPELGNYFRQNRNNPNVLYECAESVLGESRNQRLVFFIDQFEEVFTQVSQEEERIAFLNLLTHAADAENGRVVLLFAMRSDFVPNCAVYPELNATLSRQFIQIGSMQPEELVSAIAQPALRVGLRIEPELIAQIINDMKGEPGALPLMSFALKDLFDKEQAKGGMIALTLNGYFENKGINEALQRHADAALAQLSEQETKLAQSIFSNLIEIGRGTQDTKRTALFNELIPADSESDDVKAVIQKLADARLVTTEEGSDKYTITHEKLIDAWPWLKKLINENRDAITLQNEIAGAAKEWEENKRDASYLYSGGRLANIWEQVQKHKLTLGQLAQEFVKAGRRRQQSIRAALISAVSIVLIAAIVTSVAYRNQANDADNARAQAEASALEAESARAEAEANAKKAEKQAQIARVGELAAQSVALREKNFLISLLLGVEAWKHTNGLFDSIQANSALLDNTQTFPYLEQFFSEHSGPASVAFSPNGKTLVIGTNDGTIILWNLTNHQLIGQMQSEISDNIQSVAFSPDGKMLASGSWNQTIILWDVKTLQPIGQPLDGPIIYTDVFIPHVTSVAFSPDGKILASGKDGTIILWDTETHKTIGRLIKNYSGDITSIAFSPDGKNLASGGLDNTIIIWDVETQQPVGQQISGSSVVFSPDNKTLASGDTEGIIILWNVETLQPIEQHLEGHSGRVNSVAFSPDGKTLASSSEDNTVIIWDVETQQPNDQQISGSSVVFSPDGKTVASIDNDIIIWSVETRQPNDQQISGSSVVFSPDGKTVASGSYDGITILWDVETQKPIRQLPEGSSGSLNLIAFSPNGKTLASSKDGTIILWDVESGQRIGEPLNGHSDSINSVAFSPDGKTLASGSWDKTIILWDVENGQRIGQPLNGYSDPVFSVAFSPDGKTLASGSYGGTIILWDVERGQPIGQPLNGHSNYVKSVAFSPDGKTLASGSWDKTIILWDVETGQRIGQPLNGHSAPVISVAFSPDGKTLASGSNDGTIILWDVERGQPIGQPLNGHSGFVESVALSPDGKTLASSSNKSIILWDVDPESWAENACQRAGRNFTPAEWKQYFPNEEYRKTCDQWPLEP